MTTDSNELYYAEMEAAREDALDAYFEARPQLLGSFAERALFRAGFERGFEPLWRKVQAQARESQHLAGLAGNLLTQQPTLETGDSLIGQERGERIAKAVDAARADAETFQCLGCGDPVAVRMTWCGRCELLHKSIQGMELGRDAAPYSNIDYTIECAQRELAQAKCNGLCRGHCTELSTSGWLPDVNCPLHGLKATLNRGVNTHE